MSDDVLVPSRSDAASTSIPLHSPDFYSGDPYPAFKELRATTPVCWNDVAGFWAVLKYEDVRFVSNNPEMFSSSKGISMPTPGQKTPRLPGSLVFTDPPRHRQLRKLVNAGFTRRRVAMLESKVRDIVGETLDGVAPGSIHEFAEELAAPLPTFIIAEMLGAPREDWAQFRAWSDATVGVLDADIELDRSVALGQYYEYFAELIAARRKEPRDDMLSVLVNAEVDGERMTDPELLNFTLLLLIAGNETTRNLISFGMLGLIDHPGEHRRLIGDPSLIPVAVEEMLRWKSPLAHLARTATTEVMLRGQHIRKGDPVVMLYGSANRDEDIFGPDAEEFKVTRSPNPHIAFGYGIHSCLGAQLARLEARIFFEEFLRRFPKIELVGDVARIRATVVPGVKRMPVRVG